jgi:hypothetical protein
VIGKSALFYGSKCSTKGKAEERRFEDTQMGFLTAFVRVTRRDQVEMKTFGSNVGKKALCSKFRSTIRNESKMCNGFQQIIYSERQ